MKVTAQEVAAIRDDVRRRWAGPDRPDWREWYEVQYRLVRLLRQRGAPGWFEHGAPGLFRIRYTEEGDAVPEKW